MNDIDKKILLKLARDALESHFQDKDPDIRSAGHLTQLKGCFVTLHKHGSLRGCIGFPRPVMPLYEQIIAATKAAAFEDSRFQPLKEQELNDIKIEISILAKPELLKSEDYTKDIQIGKDGLIIQGTGSGLLLPQVAVEHKLDAKGFLEALCMKAELPKDAWKKPENKIYKFKCEVFSE